MCAPTKYRPFLHGLENWRPKKFGHSTWLRIQTSCSTDGLANPRAASTSQRWRSSTLARRHIWSGLEADVERKSRFGRVEMWRGGFRFEHICFPPLSSGGALVVQP